MRAIERARAIAAARTLRRMAVARDVGMAARVRSGEDLRSAAEHALRDERKREQDDEETAQERLILFLVLNIEKQPEGKRSWQSFLPDKSFSRRRRPRNEKALLGARAV